MNNEQTIGKVLKVKKTENGVEIQIKFNKDVPKKDIEMYLKYLTGKGVGVQVVESD